MRRWSVFDRTFAITGALQILATVVAFIGVLSALLSLLLEKQRELGLLRAMGLTVRELWGLVLLESGLMGAVAGVLAMPTGLALSLILIYIINRRSFGWTLQMRVDLRRSSGARRRRDRRAAGRALSGAHGQDDGGGSAEVRVTNLGTSGQTVRVSNAKSQISKGWARNHSSQHHSAVAGFADHTRASRDAQGALVKLIAAASGATGFARVEGPRPLVFPAITGRTMTFRPSGGTIRAICKRRTGDILATS